MFEYSNLPFLTKPIDKEKLKTAIEKFKSQKNESNIENINKSSRLFNKITFKNDDEIVFMMPMNILYIVADGRYSKIYNTEGNKILVCNNLGNIEDDLEKYEIFVRIHRSFIINKKYLIKYNYSKNNCQIGKNNINIELKVSDKYKENLI